MEVSYLKLQVFSFARRTSRLRLLAFSMILVVGAGCEDSSKKKSALTPEEIARLTYAQKSDRPDQLTISGETITCEDIWGPSPEQGAKTAPLREELRRLARQTTLPQFLEEARPWVRQRLNSNVTNIVLHKWARREMGQQLEEDRLDELAEQELRRFIFEHGNNGAQADEALHEMGLNRTSFKEYKKTQILIQVLIARKYPRNQPITRSELRTRYDEIKDEKFARQGVLQLRVIEVQAEKVELQDASEDPLQKARQVAGEFRKRIDAGEDFAEVARQSKRYADDPRAEQGGLWKPRDPDSLAPPYDVLARAAREMKAGDVAGPLAAPGRFFVMRVEEKQPGGYQPLSEVQEQVKESIVLERRRQALAELDAEIVRQAAQVDMSRFVDYCLEGLYRQANQTPSGP